MIRIDEYVSNKLNQDSIVVTDRIFYCVIPVCINYVNLPLFMHFKLGISIELIMLVYGLDLYYFNVTNAI